MGVSRWAAERAIGQTNDRRGRTKSKSAPVIYPKKETRHIQLDAHLKAGRGAEAQIDRPRHRPSGDVGRGGRERHRRASIHLLHVRVLGVRHGVRAAGSVCGSIVRQRGGDVSFSNGWKLPWYPE